MQKTQVFSVIPRNSAIMSKDFYEILGVSKSSSQDEIKRAYRKKAHEFHPDKGGGNTEKFKAVNEAYQVLGDEQKRKQYDQFGENFQQAGGFSGGAGSPFGGNYGGNPFGGGTWDFGNFAGGGDFGFDLGDIFGDIFGGQQQRASRRSRGIDLEMGLTVEFQEAVFGTTKTITLEKQDACKVCSGSGAEPGSKINTCPKCHGQGQIRTQRRTIFGVIASNVSCDRCQGQGKVPEAPCKTCGGSGIKRQEKTIEVKIPAGIDNGQRIRVAGEGEAGYRGSSPGDLFLLVKVLTNKNFARDGFNLLKDLPISFTQAALGAKINLSTLDGEIELKIPAGTQSGTVFKIRGKGVPYLNQPGRRGDLLIAAHVVIPKKLSKREKELLQDIAKEKGEVVEVDESLWDSLKHSFNQ